jgi:ubiquinone/menaquinone biosynthesis C-methylase UbiE
MLEMAKITTGQQVLDIAAGAGEQSITTAKKVGPSGYVLATDISSNILAYAEQMARQAGIENIETKVLDEDEGTFQLTVNLPPLGAVILS